MPKRVVPKVKSEEEDTIVNVKKVSVLEQSPIVPRSIVLSEYQEIENTPTPAFEQLSYLDETPIPAS